MMRWSALRIRSPIRVAPHDVLRMYTVLRFLNLPRGPMCLTKS